MFRIRSKFRTRSYLGQITARKVESVVHELHFSLSLSLSPCLAPNALPNSLEAVRTAPIRSRVQMVLCECTVRVLWGCSRSRECTRRSPINRESHQIIVQLDTWAAHLLMISSPEMVSCRRLSTSVCKQNAHFCNNNRPFLLSLAQGFYSLLFILLPPHRPL